MIVPGREFDDPAIPDSETLYRRVPGQPSFVAVDQETSRPIGVSSAAFEFDGDGMSAYRGPLLRRDSLSMEDVRIRHDDLVVALVASEVRSLDLGVIDDPWPQGHDGHLRNSAHCLVRRPSRLGKSADLKQRRALKDLPATRVVVGLPADASPKG